MHPLPLRLASVSLLLASACAVDVNDAPNVSETEQDISLPTDPHLDTKFYVKSVRFIDMEGQYIDASTVNSTNYFLATVNSTVHVFIELRKGPNVPATVGGPGLTDSLAWVVDPSNAIGPSNPIWSPGPDTFYTWLNLARPGDGSMHYELKGWLEQDGYKYAVSPITLDLIRTTAFAVMAPTYDEPRCQNCHSLGDSAAWQNFHKQFLPGAQSGVDVTATKFCTNCHPVDDWRAPPFSKGIDWSQITGVGQRCVTSALNLLGPGAIVKHFYLDPRLQWAYTENEGCMGGPSITSPIKNLDLFMDAVDKWAADGGNCDGLSYPRNFSW